MTTRPHLLRLRLRNRGCRLASFVASPCALLWGSLASAQAQAPEDEIGVSKVAAPPTAGFDGSESLPERRSDYSPQHWALELRFGPYSPKIENEPLNRSVRQDFFGDKTRYQFGLELDWQAWRAPHVGTLGVGLGWGYTSLSAPNQDPEDISADIEQESTLSIMPMYAVGVLRVDVFARELHVPLVPYAKFGLGWALWWVNDGFETARTDVAGGTNNGVVGRDISTGTQAAIGGMFLLDVLEPSAGAELDAIGGVNNSYIFFEWSTSNFGGGQMNVGSDTWVTGLAFEI